MRPPADRHHRRRTKDVRAHKVDPTSRVNVPRRPGPFQHPPRRSPIVIGWAVYAVRVSIWRPVVAKEPRWQGTVSDKEGGRHLGPSVLLAAAPTRSQSIERTGRAQLYPSWRTSKWQKCLPRILLSSATFRNTIRHSLSLCPSLFSFSIPLSLYLCVIHSRFVSSGSFAFSVSSL